MPRRAIGTNTKVDFDGEKTSTSYNLEAFADDGSNYAANLTALNALIFAESGITLGAGAGNQLSAIFGSSASYASTPQAQRETKWLVSYRDSQEFLDPPADTVLNPGFNKIFDVTVGTADEALLAGNRDEIYTETAGNISEGASAFVTAYVNAVETNVKSPYGGSVVVTRIKHVGANT